MARATNSLPVPLSPRINTFTSCGATRPICLHTVCMAAPLPIRRSGRSSGRSPSSTISRHVHQPADVKRLADHLPQLAGVQRLDQIIVGPQFHGLDRRVGRAVARDEDHQALGIELPKITEDIEAAAVAQADVQQDDIGRFFGRQAQPLGGVSAPRT